MRKSARSILISKPGQFKQMLLLMLWVWNQLGRLPKVSAFNDSGITQVLAKHYTV